jgi:SAM-dependent methyltransferase
MQDLERQNEEFWDELCGTGFARALGLTARDRSTIEAYDAAYLAYYPYLEGYLSRFDLAGRRVLEIGLGYGTLGEAITQRGAIYTGVDIARGPVEMMRHRLSMLGDPGMDRIVQASAAALPFADQSFDYVYSIGCLHHTGALQRSVEEVRRVLAPGGVAVVMLYHAGSARQWLHVKIPGLAARLRGRSGPSDETIARRYDVDSSGKAAPHTDFVSRRDVRRLFAAFPSTRIETRNFDVIALRGRFHVPRRRLLGTPLERWLGLDLYIIARA